MRALLHSWRLAGDLVGFAARSGRWWVPFVTVAFGIAALVVVTAKVAVPTVVYVLF